MPLASGPLMFETVALTTVKSLTDKLPVTCSPKATLPLSLLMLVKPPAVVLREICAAGGDLSEKNVMLLEGTELFPAPSVMPGAITATDTFPSATGVRVKE